LLETRNDDVLSGILERIRPIQHRVTLVQADADAGTLEALTRDPHAAVRRVVAAHARINEEVAFRLAEDQDPQVRMALRKNPACHPFVAVAIAVEDGPTRDPSLAQAEHLREVAWQGRRGGLSGAKLLELAQDWLGLDREQLPEMTIEQVTLLLEVLAGHLGTGPMPRRPRAAKGR
jgi:hypothetical protein